MAFEPEEAVRFHGQGRDIITRLAMAMDDFRAYSRTFEARGGKIAMGDPYGTPTEGMVVLHNDLVAFLAQNNRQQLLDLHRTDFG